MDQTVIIDFVAISSHHGIHFKVLDQTVIIDFVTISSHVYVISDYFVFAFLFTGQTWPKDIKPNEMLPCEIFFPQIVTGKVEIHVFDIRLTRECSSYYN